MTENKPIIINVCPYQGECSVSGCKRNDNGCFVKQLFEEKYRAENQIVELNKTIKAKTQECEELKDKIKYMKEYIKTVENARDELERENKFSKEQAEKKLGRIRVIAFHNCDITDKNDPCYKILQIIDEVENE